ncbi:MAG: FAD:protein FMN transferase [Mariprofundaceae bacterium]|nr:FAD:protein FMN transferase [Mariprofundaceae bacterium]
MRLIIRLFAISILSTTACSPASDTIHETRFIMGTLVEFTTHGTGQAQALSAIEAAGSEMQRIENLFSIYGEGSNPVKLFNQSPPGIMQQLPAEVATLLETALKVEKRSGHAFSPTLGALNKLWGFSQTEMPALPPPDGEISELSKASFACLQHGSEGSFSHNGSLCELDFGAIAKGYAIERGMEILQSHGINHAIINAGGDIKVIGTHGERPWKIGIRHPRNSGEVITTIEAAGEISIVTSGDYERYFNHQGRRYHHILDPHSGMPAARARSATIITSNAILADAWSTALFVMGHEGLPLIGKMGMNAILVDGNGRIHYSKNAESRLQPSRSPPMLRTSDIKTDP